MLKAIRGAIAIAKDDPQEITQGTQQLLRKISEENMLRLEDIISVFFTATPDLHMAYPAKAARDMGWTAIPMMCLQEMAVEGSLNYCIRVLIHVEWDKEQDIKHVYLGKARQLRPDWTD
ncbi:MAG: chorismate mutase [Peptococcaceae bacterium]